MYSLNLPNSPTALRLGADFLNVLAEHAETIRSETRPATVGALQYEVSLDTSKAADQLAVLVEPVSAIVQRQLEVATPAQPVPDVAEQTNKEARQLEVATPAPGELGSQEMDDALAADQAKLDALGAFDPAPAPEPTRVLKYNEAAAGFSLEAMRQSNWSDDQLVAAGYAEWEVIEAPKPGAPAAPSASAPTPPAPPAAPVPPAPATSGAVELDKAGLPWDERIHSSSKNFIADGTWRRKRGVDDALVATVEAELRGLAAAPAQSVPTPAPVAPAAPVPVNSGAAAGALSTFPELTQWLLGLTKAGTISPTDVQLAIMGCGVEGVNMLPHLNGRPDLIPQVVAKLREKVGAA